MQEDLRQYKKDHKAASKALHLWIERSSCLEHDQSLYVQISREMVQFVNYAFKSNAWLTLSRLKAAR